MITKPRTDHRVPSLQSLTVKIFADGADKASMVSMLSKPYIKGFTTNPTLMRKSGISDYQRFAREILQYITQHPISFEVFADDSAEMKRQATIISSWAENVYVKIPVSNTRGESLAPLIRELTQSGIKVNVTAILTVDQVRESAGALAGGAPAYISVFAGRIADTGREPVPLMQNALTIIRNQPQIELIWASPRELLNIFQADAIGCDIITVTNDVLSKLGNVGKDLAVYSLETVRMFYADAAACGFTL